MIISEIPRFESVLKAESNVMLTVVSLGLNRGLKILKIDETYLAKSKTARPFGPSVKELRDDVLHSEASGRKVPLPK